MSSPSKISANGHKNSNFSVEWMLSASDNIPSKATKQSTSIVDAVILHTLQSTGGNFRSNAPHPHNAPQALTAITPPRSVSHSPDYLGATVQPLQSISPAVSTFSSADSLSSFSSSVSPALSAVSPNDQHHLKNVVAGAQHQHQQQQEPQQQCYSPNAPVNYLPPTPLMHFSPHQMPQHAPEQQQHAHEIPSSPLLPPTVTRPISYRHEQQSTRQRAHHPYMPAVHRTNVPQTPEQAHIFNMQMMAAFQHHQHVSAATAAAAQGQAPPPPAMMMYHPMAQHPHHVQQQHQQQMLQAAAGYLNYPAVAGSHEGLTLPPFMMQRQQHPFGPRLMNRNFAHDFYLHSIRKQKRVRTAFAPMQLLKLEQAFETNQYVVGAERKELAKNLNLSETQVSSQTLARRSH